MELKGQRVYELAEYYTVDDKVFFQLFIAVASLGLERSIKDTKYNKTQPVYSPLWIYHSAHIRIISIVYYLHLNVK